MGHVCDVDRALAAPCSWAVVLLSNAAGVTVAMGLAAQSGSGLALSKLACS